LPPAPPPPRPYALLLGPQTDREEWGERAGRECAERREVEKWDARIGLKCPGDRSQMSGG